MDFIIENILLYKTYLILGIAGGLLVKPVFKYVLKPLTAVILAGAYQAMYWGHCEFLGVDRQQDLTNGYHDLKNKFNSRSIQHHVDLDNLRSEILLNEKLRRTKNRRPVKRKCFISVDKDRHGKQWQDAASKPPPNTARWYIEDELEL